MADPVRVMVVDDTITYRMIMKKVAESIAGVEVTATASNGKLAIEKLTDQFQAVLLDVEMPVMNGLETLKVIRKKFPDIRVIMVSALSRSNANIVIECLSAGAMDFVTKPLESNVEQAKAALRQSLEPILSLIGRKELAGFPAQSPPSAPPVAAVFGQDRRPSRALPPLPRSLGTKRKSVWNFRTGRSAVLGKPVVPAAVARAKAVAGTASQVPELLLIGASTGGPVALTKVLGGFGRALPVPTLIVQHMPPVFTASLAEQLSRTSGLPVKEAREGMEIGPGSIALAMGGRHMTLQTQNKSLTVKLNDGPKVNECRPAVDVLFMSVVAGFSGRVLAVILTGMGRDGTNGVDALKRAGKTYCITQDESSCVVYGMPRSVEEKGLSDASLPLDQIGQKIVEICV